MTRHRPQLSIGLANFAAEDPGGWQLLIDQARAADEAGIDRISVSDHVVFGEDLEAYSQPELGGTRGGRQPTGPDGHWLEPLTLLSVIAGSTQQVRLATGILLAALRRPAVLAKTVATLDVLSGGRVDLGVGVGWQREEYEAAGLDFDQRGRLLDHTLAVVQALWSEDRANFSDDRLSFQAIHQMPKPLQPGGLPVWVSGTANRSVARRLVRFGRGWIPWGPEAQDVVAGITRMRSLVDELGGDFSGLQVTGRLGPVRRADGTIDLEATMAAAPELAAAGVTDLRLPLSAPGGFAAGLDLYGSAVAALRRATG